MKLLEGVNLTKLTNLEFGQHVKSVNDGITALNIVTNENFKNYQSQLLAAIANYDKAMVQIKKSDETAKITAADTLRDIAISALNRYLNVFELSEIEAEVLAFQSLNTLLKQYKGIQKWNFEEETNGIESLLKDLNSDKYLPSVTLLKMNDYVARVTTTNSAFKTVFGGRTQESASKEVFDVKKLRADLKTTYVDMIDYVLVMSKALNNDEFNKSLDVINTVRKYYSDLIAKRKPALKNVTEEAIAPM
jgi:hypothetical protein